MNPGSKEPDGEHTLWMQVVEINNDPLAGIEFFRKGKARLRIFQLNS